MAPLFLPDLQSIVFCCGLPAFCVLACVILLAFRLGRKRGREDQSDSRMTFILADPRFRLWPRPSTGTKRVQTPSSISGSGESTSLLYPCHGPCSGGQSRYPSPVTEEAPDEIAECR